MTFYTENKKFVWFISILILIGIILLIVLLTIPNNNNNTPVDLNEIKSDLIDIKKQIKDILNGDLTVGNANKLGGELPDEYVKLDNRYGIAYDDNDNTDDYCSYMKIVSDCPSAPESTD